MDIRELHLQNRNIPTKPLKSRKDIQDAFQFGIDNVLHDVPEVVRADNGDLLSPHVEHLLAQAIATVSEQKGLNLELVSNYIKNALDPMAFEAMEGEVCHHGNSWTSGCADCSHEEEQELEAFVKPDF